MARSRSFKKGFEQSARRYLLAAGASEVGPLEYLLETTAGTLRVHVYDDWLACRFQDVGKALAVLSGPSLGRLNRWSGKWNFHFFGEWTVDEAVMEFDREVGELLPQCDAAAS